MSEVMFSPTTPALQGANIVPFPKPSPDNWSRACGIVAGAEAWELAPMIAMTMPLLQQAIAEDDEEQVIRRMYVVHAAATRFLIEIGRLPA